MPRWTCHIGLHPWIGYMTGEQYCARCRRPRATFLRRLLRLV